jgi:hypothetical protein
MYIVENVEKRFVRVLRSITSTKKTDRHDITEKIVKRDVEHHNPLTIRLRLNMDILCEFSCFKGNISTL